MKRALKMGNALYKMKVVVKILLLYGLQTVFGYSVGLTWASWDDLAGRN